MSVANRRLTDADKMKNEMIEIGAHLYNFLNKLE
jgi:hypothetical protein